MPEVLKGKHPTLLFHIHVFAHEGKFFFKAWLPKLNTYSQTLC